MACGNGSPQALAPFQLLRELLIGASACYMEAQGHSYSLMCPCAHHPFVDPADSETTASVQQVVSDIREGEIQTQCSEARL